VDSTGGRDALLEKVRVRILGFATYLGCGNDAEDIAQETMVVLHTRYADAASLEDLLKLGPRICSNLALNWRRHKSNPARAVELPESMPDASERDPESALSAKQLQELLLEAIRKSDDRCKEILRLRLEGARTKEIADRLRLRTGAVDTAYFRCLQRLRNALGGSR